MTVYVIPHDIKRFASFFSGFFSPTPLRHDVVSHEEEGRGKLLAGLAKKLTPREK